MRVLVACEYSGVVRDAFRALGHDAWSCDFLPGEGMTLGDHFPNLYPAGHPLAGNRFHYQCDVMDILPGGRIHQTMLLENQAVYWDMLIAHPACTHLSVSGARWATDHWVKSKKYPLGGYWHDGAEKRRLRIEALEFVERLWAMPIPHIAIENPISVLSTLFMKPSQIIQPWWFGHPEFKATCLWLKNLPKLTARGALVPPVKKLDPVKHKAWSVVHNMTPSDTRWKERSRTYANVGAAFAPAMGWRRALACDTISSEVIH